MKKILRYTTLIGIFVIPFIPLIVTNAFFFPFITGKNFIFRIVIEIIFAAWLILAVTDTAYRPRRSWILYTLGIFVIVMALADAFSMNPYKSFWSNYERMEGWVTLIHLLAYFIVVTATLTKEKLWDAFLQTALGVNCVVVLYSLLQIGHLLVINQGGVRVDATFGNATYLAIYTVFSIFIASLYLIHSKDHLRLYKNGFLALGFNIGFLALVVPLIQGTPAKVLVWAFFGWIIINALFYITLAIRKERLMYLLLIIFDIAVLYLTATRGAILGFLGGVVLASIIILISEKENKLARRISYGVIIAIVVVTVAFFGLKNTTFVQKSPVLSRFASISVTEPTTLSRFKLWSMAIEGFKERPILGWGQESFNYVFNAHYNPELYAQEQWFDRTHNIIFDWLIAGGILGLAAYIAFFASIVFYIWKRREHHLPAVERGILTGLLFAYFVNNLFVFDNLISYVFFITIAAYVYFRTVPQAEEVHTHVENKIIAPAAVVVLIIVLYIVNVKPILENVTLIQAISAPQQMTDISDKSVIFKKALSYHTLGDQEVREQLWYLASQANVAAAQQPIKGAAELANLATQEAKNQIALTPQDARPYTIIGAYYAQARDWKNALTYFLKAHDLSPQKQSIDFSVASIYLTQRDYQNAYTWFKNAFYLDQSFLSARLYFAAAAIYNHKLDVADQALQGVSTSTIASSNDILTAYYTAKQYGKVLELWKERVRLDPSNAQNHLSLAAAYLLVNDRRDAIAEIREAITIEPRFKDQGEAYIKQIQAGKNPVTE